MATLHAFANPARFLKIARPLTSVLFWLGDESEGRADTRAFIDRRIDGMMSVETVKARLRSLPGASKLADAALGWIRAPRDRALPGKTR